MSNTNLENLIDGINHISLNQEDLIEAVLDFSKIYSKNHPEDALVVDNFFMYKTFVDQASMSAREAVVLAMNAVTLDDAIDFKELIDGCVSLHNQREVEDAICADKDTQAIMQNFLKELRAELFSRLYSQNKDLERFSKISKVVLKQRYDTFISQTF